MSTSRKCIFIILEGMGYSLLHKYINKGCLPNLKKLCLNQGGKLTSSKVPYEASALQTAFTGYTAGDHGVFSYWKVHNYDYVPKIIESNDLVRPAIWQLNEFSDKKFAVINVFGTQPAYPINGYMLTYLFQQSLHACYPDDLIRKLSTAGFKYGHDVSAFYRGDKRQDFLKKLFIIERLRVNTALKLLDNVDTLIVNFTLIDRIAHFYWQEIEPDSTISEEDTALFLGYKFLDEAIGQFLNAVDDNSDILIFSDCGFGPLREFVSINDYLEKHGFLKRLKNGKTNWHKTVAFESVQGSHGININLEKRYRYGNVTHNSYLAVRTEVINCLREIINPKTGLPLFRDVIAGEEYYSGTYFSEAPDIILEPFDQRYLPLGDTYWANHVTRHNQSGWHRREAFWSGIGKHLNGIKKDCSILDIAPTICLLSQVEIPKTMTGVPIV